MSKLFNKQNFEIGKKIFTKISDKLKKRHETISSVKPAKNLTQRRKDQDDIIASVDKHPSAKSPAIKKEFTKKVSSLHDETIKKIENLTKK